MGNVLLSDLVQITKSALKPFNYKKSVLRRYDIEFRAVERYFTACGQTLFSKDLLQQYTKTSESDYNQKKISRPKYFRIRSVSDKLLQCYEKGCIEWKRSPRYDGAFKPGYNDVSGIINAYTHYLNKNGLSRNTKKNYLRFSTYFMSYAAKRGYLSLEKLSREAISEFIPFISQWYKLASMSVVLTALRSFFNFARENSYCSWDMSLVLPKTAAVKTIVYQPFTIEEEAALLKTIDRSTSIGKRDYALVLLIMRTGLRTVDVINLTIDDIDWRRKTITIIQTKTRRPLVMPLLPEVGNAMVEYLLYGRPVSDDVHVFLRSVPPYVGFQAPYSCSGIIKKYLKGAGLRQQDSNRSGAHCMRHSLACRLLKGETSLSVISSILGHSNKDSTKEYLSTDLEHLRACALTLEGIAITRGSLS